MIHKNPYTNDFSNQAISKGDTSFKRDWKPIESKPDQETSQDSVNPISKRSAFWVLFLVISFCTFIGLYSVNKTPSFNQILINYSESIK